MNHSDHNKERLAEAKRQVKRIKLFYIHLVGYLVVVALVLLNFYIMDKGLHEKAITWVNTTTLVGWTIFIFIHYWTVFKGRFLFKKEWEDRKIKEYLNKNTEEETKMWE
ncbi:2TM domain-containing protein [Winogradskyella alexanderae]|uniref:2TM domain-containing protein n=1 Tax=Winogradskyella alexanderae TaxID=2877123 RepID=A0ABS7XQ56_9FLAO|nr:2TM domain-containing protein [Winogradskyella alexanderae]MCA0132152.1 2TM domain-containing protein [Winogradskyella alexanderae]